MSETIVTVWHGKCCECGTTVTRYDERGFVPPDRPVKCLECVIEIRPKENGNASKDQRAQTA